MLRPTKSISRSVAGYGAAQQIIPDWRIPVSETDQQATDFHEKLKALETQLTELTQSDYYKQLANSGFYVVEANLADALQATRETMQANEQMISIIGTYPEDELKIAIAKFLLQTDD